MLKDPWHLEETPYDLLNLHPNAGPGEIHQALPNFMRRPENAPRLAQAMHALQNLKNPASRLVLDLLHYPVNGLKMTDAAKPPSPLVLDEFLKVPHLEPAELFCDLDQADFDKDRGEVNYHAFTLSLNPGYDSLENYRLIVEPDC
ncbi:MAG: hypothetical protein C4567_14470 [Deltaproteobacteria bacterium]|nr:MAG: hypothetical protein C4567_14470 [Deltaproteobacteria bacterium]